jgi:hypothetical protein
VVSPVGPEVAHAESEPITARSTVWDCGNQQIWAKERTLKRNHFDFAENLRERRVSDSERRQPVSDSEIGHGK